MKQPVFIRHLAAEFLAAADPDGSRFGTGALLRVAELLKKMPDDAPPDLLKHSLISILATSPAEQTHLEDLFLQAEKRAAAFRESLENEPLEVAPSISGEEKKPNRPWLWLLIALLLAATAGAAGWFYWKSIQPKPVVQKPVETTGPDTLVTFDPATFEEKVVVVDPPKIRPFEHKLTDFAQKTPPGWRLWLADNWAWFRWLVAFCLTAGLFFIWRWRVLESRKLIAEHGRTDKPPYFWNIEIPGAADGIADGALGNAASLMRRRETADARLFDISKTLEATIAAGGIPNFRFRRPSQPVDYLMLIDRQTQKNHRARLFDLLFQELRAQEVAIERFFFDSDLRLFFNEDFPEGLRLSGLGQRFGGSRLMLVGSGAQMLGQSSGRLLPWTAAFSAWKNRILLNPKPLREWGRDEQQLAELFTTMPATRQAIHFWVEELEMGDDARMENWKKRVTDAPNAAIRPDDHDPLPLLRLYFEEEMLIRIAACAIFPAIHWDLTLWLFKTISDFGFRIPDSSIADSGFRISDLPNAEQSGIRNPNSEIEKSEIRNPKSEIGQSAIRNPNSEIDYSAIEELARLPWFVEGEMPDETRAALLNWLQKRRPALLASLRVALAELLDSDPPPADSVAFQAHRMSVAVNQYLTTTDAELKKRLEKEIADLLAAGAEVDIVVKPELDRPRSPLDFIVPERWKKFVHPGGLRGLGWVGKYAVLKWMLPLWLIGLLACFWPWNFQPNWNCPPESLVFLNETAIEFDFQKEKTGGLAGEKQPKQPVSKQVGLCLDDFVQRLIFKERKFQEAVAAFEFSKLDSLAPGNELNPSFMKVGGTLDPKRFFKIQDECRLNAAADYYNLARHFKLKNEADSACLFFRKALEFDSTDVQILRDVNDCLPKNEVKPDIVLTGEVVSEADGKPVSNAPISGAGIAVKSDAAGRFEIRLPFNFPKKKLPLVISAVGFSTATVAFDLSRSSYFVVRLQKSPEKPAEQPKTDPPIDPEKDKPAAETPPLVTVNEPQPGNSGGEPATGQGLPPDSNDDYRPKLETRNGLKFIEIKRGKFTQGCLPERDGEDGKCPYDDEQPTREVTLENDFWLSQTEVTVGQFVAFLNAVSKELSTDKSTAISFRRVVIFDMDSPNDERILQKGTSFRVKDGFDNHPMVNVSWDGAKAFCDHYGFRLPSESEWEFAARGGLNSKNYKFSGSNSVDAVAWYAENSESKTHTVGLKKANELGLFDMSGNVWEWCEDRWHNSYNGAPTDGKAWTSGSESSRLLRGGSWNDYGSIERSANRSNVDASLRLISIGFRAAQDGVTH